MIFRWLLFALFLLLLVRLWPRALFVILAAAALVGGGVFAWTWHLDEERAQVAISVVHDPARCPDARPLSVTIRNAAAAPLERVTFSIHARMPGYSRVVTPYTFKQYESDKILSPGESFSACYPRPLMSRDIEQQAANAALEWSASVDNVYFQQ